MYAAPRTALANTPAITIPSSEVRANARKMEDETRRMEISGKSRILVTSVKTGQEAINDAVAGLKE